MQAAKFHVEKIRKAKFEYTSLTHVLLVMFHR